MCEGRQNLQASSLGTQLHTGDVCSQEENLEGKPPTTIFETSDPGSQVFVADGCLVTRQTLSVSSWAECLSQAWFQSNSCTHLLPSTCGGPASTCNFPSNVHSQPRRAPDLAFCMRLQTARTEPASAKGKSDIHPVHPKRQFQQKQKLRSPNHSLHHHCPVGVLRLQEPTGQASSHLGQHHGLRVQRNPSGSTSHPWSYGASLGYLTLTRWIC